MVELPSYYYYKNRQIWWNFYLHQAPQSTHLELSKNHMLGLSERFSYSV